MGEYKPIIFGVLLICLLGLVLNVFISPFVDNTAVNSGSILSGFINFVENGFTISVPFLSSIFSSLSEVHISPVTWLWLGISPVTDFVVEQLTLMTYIPNIILIPILIIILVGFAYSLVTIVRGN